jgi:hypothetical protein
VVVEVLALLAATSVSRCKRRLLKRRCSNDLYLTARLAARSSISLAHALAGRGIQPRRLAGRALLWLPVGCLDEAENQTWTWTKVCSLRRIH